MYSGKLLMMITIRVTLKLLLLSNDIILEFRFPFKMEIKTSPKMISFSENF